MGHKPACTLSTACVTVFTAGFLTEVFYLTSISITCLLNNLKSWTKIIIVFLFFSAKNITELFIQLQVFDPLLNL